MPDLLRYSTSNWSLNVWARDIETVRTQWRNMLQARGRTNSRNGGFVTICQGNSDYIPEIGFADNGSLLSPIFFENRNYEFEFSFKYNVEGASITHRLKSICDCFRFTGTNTLRGTLNLANDIGWLRLGIRYKLDFTWITDIVSFEVLPLKMDLESDLYHIQKTIDNSYPLWRFSFGQKTDQEMATTNKPHECFPLLWLALFAALRNELLDHVRIICNSPHNRLQPVTKTVSMDRISGKLSQRNEEKIVQAKAANAWDKKLTLNSMKLSVDTAENRFVKMVVSTALTRIARFSALARLRNRSPDKQFISESFFEELSNWQKDLNKILLQPLFTDVGPFDGMERESLVLHHRAGYSGVYRVWQHLRKYLDVFGRDADISVKSVAELYEVWCFLEIRNLLDDQGFTEQPLRSAQLVLDTSKLEMLLKDGLGPSFAYTRNDGVTARLSHEPLFRKPTDDSDRIYSWTVPQKPDIVLELSFKNGEKLIWVFDAKYRIADLHDYESSDLVPDDAINQMHRYRDALVYRNKSTKTRPVIGAFALFPGWYPDQESEINPYDEAIKAVGIGAFPLLPGQNNVWLRRFLADCIAKSSVNNSDLLVDKILSQDSVNIPPEGLLLIRDKRSSTL